MFAEFGQAPLCLELDLDSYDGPWQHIARFRRGSGWLMVAECTIQSEYDILTARLVAACDENENPVPSFQAMHLTECDWINPTYCDELPPDILDDLICEEEGALIARWHREKNSALAEAFETHEARIAELEGRVQSMIARNEGQIAELRQRRRHPDATPEMRLAMRQIINELDAENDELLAEMTETRAAIREQSAEFEESLWARDDLLIEVSPLHVVRWKARSCAYSDVPLRPKQYATQWLPAFGRTGGSTPNLAEGVATAAAELSQKVRSVPQDRATSSGAAVENPVLLHDLRGRANKIRRMLRQPRLEQSRRVYLQDRLAKIEARLRRLEKSAGIKEVSEKPSPELHNAPQDVQQCIRGPNVEKRIVTDLEVRAMRLRNALLKRGLAPAEITKTQSQLAHMEARIARLKRTSNT